MTAPAHKDLAQEFPEMKDAIHALKTADNHFKRLFDDYEDVAKTLHREGETMGDAAAESLKKRSLELKDQLFRMLQDYKTESCKTSCCCK